MKWSSDHFIQAVGVALPAVVFGALGVASALERTKREHEGGGSGAHLGRPGPVGRLSSLVEELASLRDDRPTLDQ